MSTSEFRRTYHEGPDLLRRLRNAVLMAVLITALGRDGPPSKLRDGRFVFLSPDCAEMDTVVNPRNKLAHCVTCSKNLNTIDLLMRLGHDFISAVGLLDHLLERPCSQRPKGRTTPAVE